MVETPAKIKRSLLKTFINTTPGKPDAPTYSLMNLGITSQNFQYNPEVTTETYIGEDAARSSVDSYKVSVQTPMTAYKGDPVFEYVDGLRRKRALGGECKTQILQVNVYAGTGGTYPAELCDATVQIGEFGGEGGKPISLQFTISLDGDPTFGEATIAEGGKVTFQKKP